jgi:hypothetical protein
MMSVSLIVKAKHQEDRRRVSVSTQSLFREYWKPIGEKLGLELVPQFDCLITDEDYRTQLRTELQTLYAWLQGHASEDSYYPEMLVRTSLLIDAVEAADPEGSTFYFG